MIKKKKAIDYLLAEQGDVYVLPTLPTTPELTNLGRLKLSYINKKVILSMGSLKKKFFFLITSF